MMDKKRIMCFGDSLTWGWVPVEEGVPTTRYPREQRWTGILASILGDKYEVIEEGLSARTINLVDPTDPRLDGSAYLPTALASHMPLDLVIIMLGTNDIKSYFRKEPFEVAVGMSKLLLQIGASAGGVGTVYPAPGILLMAPPPVVDMPNPWFQELFRNGNEKTRELAVHYANLADLVKIDFLNAGDFITTEGFDGVHFSIKNNADLGIAVAEKVKTIL